ncbi:MULTISPECIES: ABC transporter substrate-binding protein [Methanothrix]|uniref:ABC transporter substrate-binding protein n=1 Tax=Methanothrix TaxID=2222 RepID=UPI001E55142E|nr:MULTISPECIES: ABC transporter substrate-binding protein [Methanothrix]
MTVYILLVTLITVSYVCAEYPMTITDSAGREVTIQMPVERIIVLNSDAAEAVTVLGAADKIVGISDSVKNKAYYFPALKNKQSIGKWNEPDCEMIGEIARSGDEIVPNIIVISYTYPDRPYGALQVAEKLEAFKNITVVGLDFYKPENMTREVELLGKILEKEEAATRYVEWYETRKESVNRPVAEKSAPRVYVESGSKGGELSTYGAGSGTSQLLSIAKGDNIAKDLKGAYPKVGWEWVVSQNPDVIIKILSSAPEQGWDKPPSSDSTRLENTLNEILGRAGAASINAVKNDRVYIVNWEILFGLDDVVGLTYLAKILHPDVNLDPESVYREYLQFLGVDYPEDRIFVYPEV